VTDRSSHAPPTVEPPAIDIRQHVLLAPMTTLGVGGPARYFVAARTAEECIKALGWAAAKALPVFVLGGGSNVVVCDDGFPGLTLRVDVPGITVEPAGAEVRVAVGAGEDWDRFVARTVAEGWAGVECLSGIPGRVGATPIQNVGAYGQDVAQTLEAVEAIDRSARRTVRIPASECDFAYRTSRFKRDPDRFLVTRVWFRLRPGGEAALRYDGLREAVGEARASLAGVRDAVLRTRRAKGMVLDPADPDTRSDGSFFLNPVLSGVELEDLLRRLSPGEDLPRFPAPGGVKVPAAWLIERAGFSKGERWQGAGISSKHALALVNVDGATAADIRELAMRIRNRVRDRFGIALEPEPRFVAMAGLG